MEGGNLPPDSGCESERRRLEGGGKSWLGPLATTKRSAVEDPCRVAASEWHATAGTWMIGAELLPHEGTPSARLGRLNRVVAD